MSVGAAFRHARTRARLSQRELAARAGVSSGFVTRLEQGAANPSWQSLVRVAAAMQRRPELRLVPDVDASLVAEKPADRLRSQRVNLLGALSSLTDRGVPLVVTGAVAALLQGFPTPADDLHVLVHDTDEALLMLQRVLIAEQLLFSALEPEELREIVQRAWPIGDCDVQITLVPELPPSLTIELLDDFCVQVLPPADLLTEEEVASMLGIVAVRSSES